MLDGPERTSPSPLGGRPEPQGGVERGARGFNEFIQPAGEAICLFDDAGRGLDQLAQQVLLAHLLNEIASMGAGRDLACHLHQVGPAAHILDLFGTGQLGVECGQGGDYAALQHLLAQREQAAVVREVERFRLQSGLDAAAHGVAVVTVEQAAGEDVFLGLGAVRG